MGGDIMNEGKAGLFGAWDGGGGTVQGQVLFAPFHVSFDVFVQIKRRPEKSFDLVSAKTAIMDATGSFTTVDLLASPQQIYVTRKIRNLQRGIRRSHH